MSVPFHDVSIAVYRQCLPGVVATLDKAASHFEAAAVDREAVLDFALAPDMKPLRFQIQSVVHHSLGAIEGLRSGRFAPPPPTPAWNWDACRGLVAGAIEQIEAVLPDELDDLFRREVLFSAGGRQRLFTAVEFVLSFSVPNLHFHAATAYDILRLKGVPLQKLDFLGRVRGRNAQVAAEGTASTS